MRPAVPHAPDAPDAAPPPTPLAVTSAQLTSAGFRHGFATRVAADDAARVASAVGAAAGVRVRVAGHAHAAEAEHDGA